MTTLKSHHNTSLSTRHGKHAAIGVAALTALGITVAASADQVIHIPFYPFFGQAVGDQLGISVSGGIDFNHDGTPDVLVGAVDDVARIYSGADGFLLHEFGGDSSGDLFAVVVAGAGDVNNDGFNDFIVGAPQDDNNGMDSGMARVISGLDGSILYTFNGELAGDRFGVAVAGAGDVNNDGYDDLIIGSEDDVVRVHSGFDGAELYELGADATGDQFGTSVSGAGDINNDGFDDFIIGAPQNSANGLHSGMARVVSGFSGSIIHDFLGELPGDGLGISVAGGIDLNQDGTLDLIVGANDDVVRVYSGASGLLLQDFGADSVGDHFGHSVSAAGDVNGDGAVDFIVGAPQDDNNSMDSGMARVISGLDGALLYTFNGRVAGAEFGTSVSGVGDVNGDGFDDFVVGAPHDSTVGTAQLFVSVHVKNPCPGDSTGDGKVDVDDLNVVLSNFGQMCR